MAEVEKAPEKAVEHRNPEEVRRELLRALEQFHFADLWEDEKETGMWRIAIWTAVILQFVTLVIIFFKK